MLIKIKTPLSFELNISACDEDKSVVPTMQMGYYEPHIQNALTFFSASGNSFLDIGANFGQHTALVAKNRPDFKIVAIEGSEINCKHIEETLRQNEIENVNVVNAVLSDSEEPIEFFHEESNAACAFSCSTEYGHIKHKDISKVIKPKILTDVINFQPTLIKMDIEGSELKVLKSSSDIFSSASTLVCELNKFTAREFFNYDVFEIAGYVINQLGFERIFIFSKNWVQVSLSNLKEILDNDRVIMLDAIFTK